LEVTFGPRMGFEDDDGENLPAFGVDLVSETVALACRPGADETFKFGTELTLIGTLGTGKPQFFLSFSTTLVFQSQRKTGDAPQNRSSGRNNLPHIDVTSRSDGTTHGLAHV